MKSKARQQILAECFSQLLLESVNYIEDKLTTKKKWNGYRLMAIDGVKVQVPDTIENKETFGVNVNKSATKQPYLCGTCYFLHMKIINLVLKTYII